MPHPYVDQGVEITTHSMIKCMSRCPKQFQYKYVERLKKKVANEKEKALRRGIWIHRLLEVYYQGGDWKAEHKRLSDQFGQLFDEERAALGDLPREIAMIMRSYLWHYGVNKSDPFHGWDVKGTEVTLEAPWPDGRGVYRCRVDMLVHDDYGLWLVDHKSHKTLPGLTFRLMDYQSALYIWCAWENNLDVRGFIWNYIRTKVPGTPELAYAGTSRERLSTAKLDTDWVTYYLAVKELGRLDDPVAKAKLAQLKSQRWQPDAIQTSPFFRREILEKPEEQVMTVVQSAMRTRNRITEYDFGKCDMRRVDDIMRQTVERTTDRSCDWCTFKDLCETELMGGNARATRRLYRIGDPLDYYRDDKDSDSTRSD